VVGSCEHCNELSSSMYRISCVGEWLFTCHEGLWSMELDTALNAYIRSLEATKFSCIISLP
jgi:hypothetical protein